MERRERPGAGVDRFRSDLRRGNDSRELVLALRARNERAAAQFIERYKPLMMDVARRFKIPPSEAEERALTFLSDRIMELIEGTREPPRSLAGYLVSSFANQLINNAKQEDRRGEALTRELTMTEGEEPIALGTVSENLQRESDRWGDGVHPLPRVLARLVHAMEEGLSLENRVLLGFMAKQHSHERIAGWLGINEKAASKRIERLHRLCFERAVAHGNSLPLAERRELCAYFDRWAVVYGLEGPNELIVNAEPPPRRRR